MPPRKTPFQHEPRGIQGARRSPHDRYHHAPANTDHAQKRKK